MDIIQIFGASIKDQVKTSQSGTGASGNLQVSVGTIINFITGFFAVLAVIAIILGGVQLTASQGDPGKAKKGKDTITAGIIGLIICLFAFMIVNFVIRALQGSV